ncbi:MAG: Nif3-like dinuclear metal center hexameric protein [Sulfuriflexus sp.]|nr:Nif3-like dinuclear metal center hexameric protein [Sulfuriflexus sp.]
MSNQRNQSTQCTRQEIITYLETLLDVGGYRDYCPNGLQVEGRNEITHIVSGVTASQALIEAAIEQGADALLVHHGYFWKGESPTITGIKRQRIQRLLESDINLLAYHLPLDGHAELGNNVQLARVLELNIEGITGDSGLLYHGSLKQACDGDDFAAHIESCLGRSPQHIPADRSIKRVAWCTGGAQSYIEEAAELGVDAFITGEISEQTVHIAREMGIHFYAAGHHATERYGVQALGTHLSAEFGLKHTFIDIDNPV